MSEHIYKLFEGQVILPEIYTEALWYVDGHTISYVPSGDVDDFDNGKYYNDDIRYKVEDAYGRYVLFNLTDCCGEQFQAIFSKSGQRTLEEIESMLDESGIDNEN